MENKWDKPRDLTEDEAYLEASRCLSCKKPMCQTGCPTSMRIRDFIYEIKNHNLEEASSIIATCSSLSNICSVVCPHENQCMGYCVLGKKGKPINIGALEKFVQNNTNFKYKIENKSNKKVAIVGAGPAGLACAKELARNNCSVTIFEKDNAIGGVMTYGIPSYRLDYQDIVRVLNELKELNVNFVFNTKLKESDILKLKDSYDAVFIACGLPNVRKLGIPNENILGVYDALELLKKSNSYVKLHEGEEVKINGDVIVVGAGNVAMDAARSAVRLGAKSVTIVYRRSMEEAPATKHEINDAITEGVLFKFLTNPVEVIGTDKVEAIKCEVMELSTPDESGRKRPVGTGKYIEIKCDCVIKAIGQIPDDIYDAKVLETDHGYIKASDNFETNIENIYVGGDVTLGAKTVVEAMRSGRIVASNILNK